MRSGRVLSVLALFTILSALNLGAQTGAGSNRQPTPEQLAKMPVRPLQIKDFKLLSPNIGWVSTGNRILLTTDNGEHWKDISPRVPTPTDPHDSKFSGVYFLDDETGWLLYATDADDSGPRPDADGHPDLYHTHVALTTDGGGSWTTVSQLPRLNPWQEVTGGGSITFSDRVHGWVDLDVTHGGVLFGTSDGGRTWQRPNGDPHVGSHLVAPTSKDIWLAGGRDYKLFVSHDGANTFQEVSLPFPQGIEPDDYPTYSLPVFADSLNGYEVVDYSGGADRSGVALFATTDGGRIWRADRALSNLPPSSAGERSSSAVADSTWILPFVTRGSEAKLFKLFPKSGTADAAGFSLQYQDCDLSFLSADVGWMRCAGVLSSTVDGGATWTAITPRVRDGALTTAPITSQPTSKPLKTQPIRPAAPRDKPTAADALSGAAQNGADQQGRAEVTHKATTLKWLDAQHRAA